MHMPIMAWAVKLLDDDVATPEKLCVHALADIEMEGNDLNMLAMMLFVGRHANAQARALCQFVAFPAEPEEQERRQRALANVKRKR